MADYATERTRNEALAVGTSNVVVSRSKTDHPEQNRKVIILRNISTAAASVITINLGQSATANTGIVLKQYESFQDVSTEGYRSFQGQINAICADANGNLAILEVVGE